MVILKKLWHEVTNPRVEEEGGARQEYLTRVIYTLVSAGLLIMTTVVLVINYGIGEPNNESTLVMASMDILIVIGWLLIQNKHWRLSGYLLPFVFLMFSGYMVFTVGPVTTAVLQLAIAVLLAGMLSGNRARWIMLVICLVVYVAAGWGSGERDFELFLTSGILIFMSLGGIALLDWFFSNLLNKSLRTVREREVKLDSIFRAAPIGIGMVVDRVIQEANDTLCKMTGYSREELIGNSARMLYPSQEDYEYVGTEKYRQIHEQEVGTVETRWRRKDGVIRDILLSSVPLDSNDFSHGVTFTALDITKKKQMETDLRESEALYHDLVETAQDLIWQCDLEGKYVYLNPAWEVVFGYKIEEMLGKPFSHFQSPYYAQRDLEKLAELVRGGSLRGYETVHIGKDGRPIHLVFNAKHARDEQENIIGTRGTAYDITERKQAELALLESERRYRSIVESSPLGIHLYELQVPDRLVFVGSNPAADEILNLDNSKFIGKTIEEAFPALAETEVPMRYKDAASEGIPWRTEQIEYDAEGIRGAFEVVAFPISTNKMVAMFHDITTRKQAEDALRMKTRELETLFSISKHLRIARSADEMLPLVVKEMGIVLEADTSAIILLGPDGQHFKYAFGDGVLAANKGKKFPVEKSISGLVLQTNKPYVTEDLSSDPKKTTNLLGAEKLGPAVIAPLLSEEDFLGVLVCARNKKQNALQFSTSEMQLLTAIGEMVGNALRRARLYDQALARLQNVQALHSIDIAISANLELSVVLDILLSQGAAQLVVDAASILLLNPHTHILEYAAGYGFRTKEIESAFLRLGEGLPGKATIQREILNIPDISTREDLVRRHLLDEGFVSYQAAPLVAKGQVQGVLEIFNRSPLVASEEQVSFLETLATQAAIAIDNSQLFINLQRSNFELEMAYDATIEGWSRALELRDQETEGHTLRVADMTLQLAQAVGVRSKELIQIRRGALLHDIGKMGVPDRILLKPGKLDDKEWEIMKQHTVYAFEMLRPIEFLRSAIDIPYCHHERWDGTGYPRQLKGEQIPLPARIFTVADVWDALTSDRPYRDAWSKQDALEYIRTNAGKHFEPQVVEVFLDFLKKNGLD